MNRIVGVKNYGFDWFTEYGLSEAQAAEAMVRHGIDWTVVQNMRDPLPTSAVAQRLPGPSYDDRRLRDELRGKGIRTFEATAVFFQPEVFDARPDMRPIDANGKVMERFGWYVGLCPSSPDYLAERAAIVEEVSAALQSDGLFLGFIRFPGFWEMWMPDTTRAEIPEYCFCERCLARFQQETATSLPDGPIPMRAAILQHELRDRWTAWKCGVIANVIATLKAAAQRSRPGADVLINGLGFNRGEYGNAVAEVLGQDIEYVAGVAEHIELMLYDQISRREPYEFVATETRAARARTNMTLLASLQTKVDYLDPIYASGKRRTTLTPEDHDAALLATLASPADGIMVYRWLDYLESEVRGDGRMIASLRAYKDGSLKAAR
jgi:hypothetical protein